MTHTLDDLDPLDARQFRVAVRKLADDISYGTDRSPFRGSGIEFVQARPYVPGDPVKSIDWRVTARTGKVHVKEYEAPKRMPCYLLVDTSASMVVSSTPRSKYRIAVQVAGGIALACLDRVSPVGVLGVGGRDLRVEPSLSSVQIMQWLLKLKQYRHDEPTTLGRRVAELAPLLHSRSLVIALSDLHDPQALPALRLLAQQHDCVAVQLCDPAEAGVRGAGFVRAREAETGRASLVRAARRWLEPDAAAHELRRAGVDHLTIRTDQPFTAKLRQFFGARGLLGRGAR